MSAEHEPKNGKFYTICGAAVSVLWLGGLAIYGSLNVAGIKDLAPNELGDALAGAFAPLAFLWLVLGYFQQGVELRNSGKALWLQGEELKNSVEQQRELVSVTREQLIFESDHRKAEEAEKHRSAQPYISIKPTDRTIYKNNYNYLITISNNGKTCTDVHVYYASKKYTDYSKLELGSPRQINLSFTDGSSFESFIRVTYIDERMNSGELIFILKWKDNTLSINRMHEE